MISLPHTLSTKWAAATAFALPIATFSSRAIAQEDGDPDFAIPQDKVSSFTNDGSFFSSDFASIGNSIVNVLLIIAGIVAVLFLIWYGFQYITSGGDPEKAKTARAGIINAVIGIIVIVAAFTIVQFAVSIGGSVDEVTNTTEE